ncbi:hypothetical protein [Silicimonas sp. MF1-12-2]|uniref:hypothetical protein n=1 Tax=Silicimonas sp. MF1-12-2 TaxID=3384793 RepID=UPI0039B3D339
MLTLETPDVNQSSFFDAFRQAVRQLTSVRAKSLTRKVSDLEANMLCEKHAEDLRARVDHLRLYYGAGL